MKKTVLKLSTLLAAAIIVAGCAEGGTNTRIEALANQAISDSAAATSAAEAARAAADRATQAAAAAQVTADEAMVVAIEAVACCEANRESMERMFQKTMSK